MQRIIHFFGLNVVLSAVYYATVKLSSSSRKNAVQLKIWNKKRPHLIFFILKGPCCETFLQCFFPSQDPTFLPDFNPISWNMVLNILRYSALKFIPWCPPPPPRGGHLVLLFYPPRSIICQCPNYLAPQYLIARCAPLSRGSNVLYSTCRIICGH